MSTGRNVVANVGGRIWAGVMSFAFVPFYLKFLGVEAYGLIGFFASMLAIFFVLDMGLSTTVNRELARLDARPGAQAEARTLLRTLESVYWAIGVVLALGIVLAAPAIADRWLNVRSLPLGETTRAIQLMGVGALLRWPVSLYTGALMGMRRHVGLNLITAFGATLQGAGAVLVLWLASPTVTAFFGWQIAAAAAQLALLVAATWRPLRLPGHRPRFTGASLRAIMGFSAGITGITLLSVVLTQLDKLVLSKLLPLEQFGYYSLAGAIATTLTTAAGAVYGAIFPALAHLVGAGRLDEVSALYHKSCQFMSVLILPAGVALALFAPELLALYLHDPVVAARSHLLLSLFAIGNTVLALMMLPLALQLAFGWTGLSLWKNVVAVIAFVPMLLFMVGRFGAPGAAAVWVMLCVGYFLVEVQIMHRRLLRGEQWRWYLLDVGVPAAVSVGLIGAARLIVGRGVAPLPAVIACTIAAALALAVSALLLPATRQLIVRRVGGRTARRLGMSA